MTIVIKIADCAKSFRLKREGEWGGGQESSDFIEVWVKYSPKEFNSQFGIGQ